MRFLIPREALGKPHAASGLQKKTLGPATAHLGVIPGRILCLLLCACHLQLAADTVRQDPVQVESQVRALDWPRHDPVPGGVAWVRVPNYSPTDSPRFQNRSVWMLPRNGSWWAIVGIPLQQMPGTAELVLTQTRIPFLIHAKEYEESRIYVSTKYVVPDPKTTNRIIAEREEISAQFRVHSARQPGGGLGILDSDTANNAIGGAQISAQFRVRSDNQPRGSFDPPVAGPYSSLFGLRRFFNDQPRNPHSGLDIVAPKGTDVASPAAGLVLMTGDYYYNGKTVFLDHGQGLISMYCHLDRIDVRPGQEVGRGAKLGTVGATGRVTGAHLHWSVNLNGTMVDPLLFLHPGSGGK